MNGLQLLGTGRCLPSRRVTNEDFARTLDTSDAWITERTGIRQRYFCAEGETAVSLAVGAARQALEAAGVQPGQVGLCIAATFTADRRTPALACEVQAALGLPQTALCLDINAACTGFVAALETARCLLLGGQLAGPYALVLGAEKISSLLDFSDRSTCVLFGDGAGAAVVRLDPQAPWAAVFGTRGDGQVLHGGGPEDPYLAMDGRAVFRFAVETVPVCIRAVLDKAGLTLDAVDHLVLHQANSRIIHSIAKKLEQAPARFYENMQRYGNTSAASIPIALDEMRRAGQLCPGQTVLCAGFGAGLTWGGVLLRA